MSGPRNDPPRAGSPDRFRVGDRLTRGTVSCGVGPNGVWVNCALLGTGVTADISAAEAELLADYLHAVARQVRAANRKR